MAMNLDAVLKIAAKVTGQGDIGKLGDGIRGLEKSAGAARDGFKAMLGSAAWQAAAAGAAALTAGIVLSTRAAIDFEESVADVRKVVDGLDTPAGLAGLREELFELSSQMPVTAQGFAQIYAAAGEAGIARNEIRQFAQDVGMVSVAFGLTAEQAGDAMAKLRTALGLTQPELMDLADAMNTLSNNVAANAGQITEFMKRAGVAGKTVGLTAQQTAAFGAAMIAAGAETEVAATSFNNMVKALSRGESMTSRQTSALFKLGLASTDAAEKERELTEAVVRESDARIAAAERETSQLSKEINRRYRDQLTALQDGWDDQMSAQEREIRRRYDAQIKALQGQDEANRGAADQQIEVLKDAQDRELTLLRRAARDRQQVVKDQLEDQQEAELDGVQERFKELQTMEKANQKLQIERAKEVAAELSAQAGAELAKRLNQDAVGTIRDVFERIRALPQEMQLSVVSDLFGDEARALLPIIQNTALLEKTLGLVGDKSQYAGSTMNEYMTRVQTTAAQVQIAQNQIQNLSIALGEQFIPAIIGVINFLNPLIEGFRKFAQDNPVIAGGIALISSAFIALVAAAPFISSFITLIGQLIVMFPQVGVLWAGLMTVFQVGLGGFITWLGSVALPAILAFFSGPVGWTVLAVAAVVAMALLFREPITKFFTWLSGAIGEGLESLWEWGEPIRKWWISVWNGLKGVVTGFFKFLAPAIRGGMRSAYAIASQVFVAPWVTLWTTVLRQPVNDMFQFLQDQWGTLAGVLSRQWQLIRQVWTDYVITPITTSWGQLMELFDRQLQIVVGFFTSAWDAIRGGFQNYIVTPIQSMWNGIIDFLKGGLNAWLRGFGSTVNAVVTIVNRLISAFNQLPGPDIGFLPTFTVPQFAKGGVVSAPTLAMVGEGGEPEYIVPESKMAKASANFLSGARGQDVLGPAAGRAQGSADASGAARVTVNVQTGPVMEFNGERWVKAEDLNRAMQETANAVLSRMRTPRARMAQGVL